MAAAENVHGAVAAHSGETAAAAHTSPELPNFIGALHESFPENAFLKFLYTFENQIFAFIVIGVIAYLFWAASQKRSLIPGRLQAVAEMLIESLLGLICSILGEKEGRKHFPFLASLFIFILGMNWFGLIPLMKSPTSHITITASLALCVFLYVQFNAVKGLGLKGFLYHLLGEPKDAIGWVMTPLFLPLHVLEELIKPVSLACRLYGNIFGEDTLLGVLMVMGVGCVVAFWSGAPFGIPFHFPFIFLALLVSVIQALVFTLLSTIYISMVMPHHEHHEEESKA
ncbi:MAG: F0F1 ATP synthase subunit A [Candidatus Omnitrophota bacterium]